MAPRIRNLSGDDINIYIFRRTGIDNSWVRMLSDVGEWKHELREMEVVLDAWIHGNMLDLSVSVPTYVITPGYNVLGLVQKMKFLHMSLHNERLMALSTWERPRGNIRINGHGFGRNRWSTYFIAQYLGDTALRFQVRSNKLTSEILLGSMWVYEIWAC